MAIENPAAAETRILLLRHAETAAPDSFHGSESDIPLGERGFQQAEAGASPLAAFRPDFLASSAMLRARQTAAPIAAACGFADWEILPALHERHMGDLAGQPRAMGWGLYAESMERWEQGDLDHTHEGGESYRQLQARVVPVFLDLASRHAGKTGIVVAHGVVIRVLITCLAEGYTPADFTRIPIEHVAPNDLRFDGKTWRVAALNMTL